MRSKNMHSGGQFSFTPPFIRTRKKKVSAYEEKVLKGAKGFARHQSRAVRKMFLGGVFFQTWPVCADYEGAGFVKKVEKVGGTPPQRPSSGFQIHGPRPLVSGCWPRGFLPTSESTSGRRLFGALPPLASLYQGGGDIHSSDLFLTIRFFKIRFFKIHPIFPNPIFEKSDI